MDQSRSGRVDPPASLVPEVKDPGLDDEPEQVLQGLEGGEESLSQQRLIGVAHVVVQDFGELPEREESGSEGEEPQEQGMLGNTDM